MTNITKIFKEPLFYLIVILILTSYFSIFWRLGSMYVHIWDEARIVNNSIEMSQSTNKIIVTCDGKPDYWNSKPPLAIWIQGWFMKTFGYNELMVRLPSGIAAFLSLGLIIFFAGRYLNNYYIGVLASFILISIHGFISLHLARSADVDSILILFTTLYTLSYFAYIAGERIKYKKLLLLSGSIGLLCAIYTKGIAGLIPAFGILIFSFYRLRIRHLLTDWKFHLSWLMPLIIGVAYYIIRSNIDPGYWNAILDSELGLFMSSSKYAGKHPEWIFYFKHLFRKDFSPYVLLIPVALYFGFTSKQKIINDFTFYSFFGPLAIIFIMSFTGVKNEWYIAPEYPILALLVGVGVIEGYHRLSRVKNPFFNKPITKILIVSIVFGSFFVPPYIKTINNILAENDHIYELCAEGAFIRELHKKYPEKEKYTVFQKRNNHILMGPTWAYQKMYALQHDKNITIKHSASFMLNEFVALCETEALEELKTTYSFRYIYTWNYCHLIQITGRK